MNICGWEQISVCRHGGPGKRGIFEERVLLNNLENIRKFYPHSHIK